MIEPAADSAAGPAPEAARTVGAAGRVLLGRALVLLLVAFGLTWPQVLHPHALYGASGGEVDNHFWMYWAAVERLGPGPLTDFPHGWEIPLMDPISLPFWLSASWIRPELGYSAVLWGNLVLAGFGGGALAVGVAEGGGRWGGRPGARGLPATVAGAGERCTPAFWTGAVAAMACPPLLGFMEFGITEAWAVGWLGLHAAALLTWGRTGKAQHLICAVLAAAAVWVSGWYNAFFMLVLEPFLWVACRRWSWGLPLGAACAAVPRLPALWDTHVNFHLWSSRLTGICSPIENRGWIARPFCGVDLLALVRPSPEPLLVSHAMYVGLGAIVLGAVGLASCRDRVRGGALAAGALLMWALALGDQLRLAGKVVWDHAPAGWLTLVLPALRAITHWERAEVPAGMLLAGLAGAGAVRLGGWWRLAPAVLIADTLLFGGQQFPRQSYATDAPAELVDLPGKGALLLVPVDNTFDPPHGRSRRPYNQWQVYFHRPVSENYEGPDHVSRSPAIKYLNRLCGVRPGPGERPAPPSALSDLRLFRADGFEWLVVVPELAPNSSGCVAAVTAALGQPEVGGRIAGWRL
ncbi:MAG: hypothetical protein EXR69_06190 [Myxococcales bacterium]|nr:hypothetical protein [Myxococcales bacterium]